jgi:hypothetical protein
VKSDEAVAQQRIAPVRAWRAAHYLAVVGFVFLFWQGWSIVSWLADGGPQQVTKFRDRGDASWVAARVYEGLAIAAALGVGWYVVRKALRERRLTVDAKICIAGALTIWLDPLLNMLLPVWTYSSNFVNVSTWCPHTPFVVNPDCGRIPEPILFVGLVTTFGVLLFAMILCAFMRWLRRRRPDLSSASIVGLAFLVGMAVDLVFEIPPFKLGLWAFPGAPDWLSIFGNPTKYPLIEVFMGSLMFTGIAAVRFFTDDRGDTIAERGLGGRAGWRRGVVSLLGWVAISNSLFMAGNIGDMMMGFYADPYHETKMESHIRNDMCGTGTRYGACPGSPDFRMPVRTLPGPKPFTAE